MPTNNISNLKNTGGTIPMIYGYVRVSAGDKDPEKQVQALQSVKPDKIYTDSASGRSTKRPELENLYAQLHKGDTVYVSELSKIAGTAIDLCEIAEVIMSKGATLKSLKEKIDLKGKTEKITYRTLKAMAEFERATNKERQAYGIAVAKANGKTWGTAKKYGKDTEKRDATFKKYLNGEIGLNDAMREAEMSYGSFYYQYNRWCKDNGLISPDKRKEKRQ